MWFNDIAKTGYSFSLSSICRCEILRGLIYLYPGGIDLFHVGYLLYVFFTTLKSKKKKKTRREYLPRTELDYTYTAKRLHRNRDI